MKENLRNKIVTIMWSVVIAIAVVILTVVIVSTGCNHKCEKDIIDDYPIWLEEEQYTPYHKEPMFMLSDAVMDSIDMGCGE